MIFTTTTIVLIVSLGLVLIGISSGNPSLASLMVLVLDSLWSCVCLSALHWVTNTTTVYYYSAALLLPHSLLSAT